MGMRGRKLERKKKRKEALKQLRKEAQRKEKFSRELAEMVEIPEKYYKYNCII